MRFVQTRWRLQIRIDGMRHLFCVLVHTRWRLQILIDGKDWLLLCCCGAFQTGALVVLLIRKLLESFFLLVQIFREEALAIVLLQLLDPCER